jgi:hypothetical protein
VVQGLDFRWRAKTIMDLKIVSLIGMIKSDELRKKALGEWASSGASLHRKAQKQKTFFQT